MGTPLTNKEIFFHDFGAVQKYTLTLSRLGRRLVGVLSLPIHISHNNGAINTIRSGKVVVNVSAMHFAL